MPTLTKSADSMKGVNTKLSEMTAAAAGLSLKDKQALLESLASDISAAATDSPTKRLARVQAAAASKDKRTAGAFKVAVAGLHALGLKLDAVCASGDISALDKLMRENRWSAERSINLKAALGVIGAA
jgi:hypothetical protein